MNPLQIRKQMVDALRLDLVGPEDGLGSPDEILAGAAIALVSHRLHRAAGRATTIKRPTKTQHDERR